MEITEQIKQLKQEKNAVILAHYYVPAEVQEIADYIGDSFYLSKVAVGLKEQMIIFCGVSFMGESAKILNPDKTVLMPDLSADCAMAHMADKETIQKMRDTYDDLAVVCYINSTAELKQYSDVCVTSANAVKIVKALPQKYIFFIPDRNLQVLIGRNRRPLCYDTGGTRVAARAVDAKWSALRGVAHVVCKHIRILWLIVSIIAHIKLPAHIGFVPDKLNVCRMRAGRYIIKICRITIGISHCIRTISECHANARCRIRQRPGRARHRRHGWNNRAGNKHNER